MFGVIQTVGTCPTCHGLGKKFDQQCSICNGSGVTREKRKMSVRIPAGITDGATIRVTSEGEAGERGHEAGDLYVHVCIKSDPRFTRDGDDVTSETFVPFADAALGTTVPVETVDGRVELKIPAGTQPGTVLKLKGKGITHLRSGGRGDHLVTVIVEVPKKLSKKQKELLEKLRDES
jgi:molecular chaperone DnaJ